MKKLTLMTILALFVLSVQQYSYGTEKEIKDEMISISLGSELQTMDPHTVSSALATGIHRYVFDTLMHRPKGSHTPIPWAAKAYKYHDAKTVDFIMREGVKFANGEDVDAEAVKFSLMRPLGEGFKTVQARRLRMIDRVEIVSKWVARVYLKKPSPGLLITLSDWGNLVPPKYYSSISQDDASIKPVGSGPYKLQHWKKGVEMVFEARPDYWHPDYPKVKRIRLVPIKEAGTKVAALLKGEVDLINNVAPQYLQQIEENANTKVEEVRGTRIYHVGFPLKHKSLLQDIRIRKAVAYAIDREAIVEAVVEGHGAVGNSPLHEWTEGHDPDFDYPFKYNPEMSKKLLVEAGYPNGFSIDFIGPVGRYIKGKEVCEAIAGMLNKVGIQAKYVPLTWGAFVSRMRGYQSSSPEERKTFLWYGGYGNGSGNTDACFNALISCTGAWSLYCNPSLQEKLDEATAIIDREKREQLYREITEEMVKDACYAWVWQENSIYGMTKRIVWDVRNDDRVYAWELDIR